MKKKLTLISVIVALLLVALIVMAVALANSSKQMQEQLNNLQTETVLTAEDFQAGGINVTTGKLDSEDEYALMTQNYHKLDGATIKFDAKESTFTYYVFFYNQDKAFIGKTDALKEDYALTAPAETVYFRIMLDTDETKPTEKNIEMLLSPITVTVKK